MLVPAGRVGQHMQHNSTQGGVKDLGSYDMHVMLSAVMLAALVWHS